MNDYCSSAPPANTSYPCSRPPRPAPRTCQLGCVRYAIASLHSHIQVTLVITTKLLFLIQTCSMSERTAWSSARPSRVSVSPPPATCSLATGAPTPAPPSLATRSVVASQGAHRAAFCHASHAARCKSSCKGLENQVKRTTTAQAAGINAPAPVPTSQTVSSSTCNPGTRR
jgi:hypothetical protein